MIIDNNKNIEGHKFQIIYKKEMIVAQFAKFFENPDRYII
jgi:hypothetical protein